MNEMTELEFRQETEAPTEPGWYYGIFWPAEDSGDQPQPQFVMRIFQSEPLTVFVSLSEDRRQPLKHYRWYGPVRQVRVG